MKFWDSSALVPLLLDEPNSAALRALLKSDQDIHVWWATSLECTSAIVRRERHGDLDSQGVSAALQRLRFLAAGWNEVTPSEPVRTIAARLLRVHPLRVADSLQLAAAIQVADGRAAELPFVSLDERLNEAADREGFPIALS